jgi:hypothetical protein
LRANVGVPLERAEHKELQRLVTTLKANLSTEVFEKEWEIGRSMPLLEAIAQALA